MIAILMLFAPLSRGEDRVERFPAPDFRSGYVMPKTQTSPMQSRAWEMIDVAVLAAVLSFSAYLVYTKRSRKLVFITAIAALGYFGFYRRGCICPVGSTQNVALAAGANGYVLPWSVAALFVLPLLFALFFGRVFCSSVCALGAVQDLVLWKPVHVPAWLEASLGLIAYAYLGLGVLFAAVGSDFLICRYDPFVGFFRMSGPAHMIVAGGVILALCLFVGRTYCRFLCPYSVLLRMLSIFSHKRVSITPTDCIDCRLCEKSCPFGAIRFPSPRKAQADRRAAIFGLAAIPALMVAFACLGYLGSSALSRRDFTVRLAHQVHHKVISNETKAFKGTGQTTEQLYASAAKIQHRFAIGTPIFGAWMGLAIGGRVLGLILQKRRSGYTADPAGCVACARCFASCPVENPEKMRELELATA
jgi:polyferredoxin